MSAEAAAENSGLTITVPLRYRDMDMIGHLNQAVYHTLLESGRIDLLNQALRDWSSGYVLAKTEINYRREVVLGDVAVTVHTGVQKVGNSSVVLAFEIRKQDGTLAADGHNVLVAFDLQARTSRTWSEAEKAGLQTFALPQSGS